MVPLTVDDRDTLSGSALLGYNTIVCVVPVALPFRKRKRRDRIEANEITYYLVMIQLGNGIRAHAAILDRVEGVVSD